MKLNQIVFLFLMASILLGANKSFARRFCTEVYRSEVDTTKTLEKFLYKAEKLNPDLVEGYLKLEPFEQNLESLYMILKEEGWRLLPQGLVPWKNKPELSHKVLQLIKEHSSTSYTLDHLTPEEIYMFYANGIQGLYIGLAKSIRDSFLTEIAPNTTKSTRHFLELIYEDLLLADLGLAETSPARAKETLEGNMDTLVQWSLFTKLSTRFYSEEILHPKQWLEAQPEYSKLSRYESQLFLKNIVRKPNPRRYCCLNNPGCLFCPNNRYFLTQ